MSINKIIPMIYHSEEHIAAILQLERECTQLDPIPYNAGIEHLAKKNGDFGILYYHGDKLAGLLSWHSSDGIVGNVNARVHPHYRRQGVFRSMLQRAQEDMKAFGIRSHNYRIPKDSEAGIAAAKSLGAVYDHSEFQLVLNSALFQGLSNSELSLFPERPEDLEFEVACMSQAFGDSESWVREYLAGTADPARTTYIAWRNHERVGMIRVNVLNRQKAILHDFCILPSCQGQRLGTQALVKTVECLLHESYTYIRLSVVTDNERALNLYRKIGFEISAMNLFYMGTL
ncbi:GNAT family N-acetyltransferase [Cohnella lubricantis]|uniref:GNAT family N-acetyltransferase n=1 Tax=Cohnella lubricantis TaxID=2163172 RepID=A0A841TFL5_9BACL|nr:GNAT family N-acetyltransferase [Cohnella lubricantis]MBB6678020.1 GNAT family N-acetyltransferase [Cohnella lubricantis]MBP2118145.1 ribosomal protein S18 acetylase RimI-like enzyme [Cohnella lubricantis]